ncbi:MAG: hypothetical protein K2Y37_01145 [Pirellulales bacterium]|nr:hypothetical protein [Pirellulales bacterium]
MDRRSDFASDLAAVHSEVAADVGGIIDAVRAKKASKATRPDQMQDPERPQEAQITIPERPKAERQRRIRSTPPAEPEARAVLENVTTRLHRETNELLTEASLHQRLKKLTPATRQDIIEVAVQEWLHANGYRGV